MTDAKDDNGVSFTMKNLSMFWIIGEPANADL